MKRKVRYLICFMILFLLFPSLVDAKRYSKNEIDNGSYIIGTYLFNKNQTQSYNGILTTPMIMLSSKSIDSNNLNDMKIYFKNSRGKWINAITGEIEKNVPSSFEITCVNLDCKKEFLTDALSYENYGKSDVDNGVYLIGTYMFKKELNVNTNYNGTLTTSMIMLSSKSIDSNNLNDMKIYFKNSRGKWINVLTGKVENNVPNDFKVSHVNLEGLEKIAVDGITLNKSNLVFEDINKSEDLIVTITPTNATDKVLKWTSSDESVVVVDQNGKVTAKKNGVATITVTDITGKVSATCNVTVAKKLSSDATLKELTISNGVLSPIFRSEITKYTVTVPFSITSLMVSPTVNNTEAKVIVSGNNELAVGSNTVTVEVIAEDGTKKEYIIVVTREKDSVNTLKSLSLTNCTLSPSFASETTDYTCTVADNITSTTVSAQATSNFASISGIGNKILDVGENVVTVKVTAQDGITKFYTIKITRQPNTNATLKSLEVIGYTLNPTFESGTKIYTLVVPYNVDSITIVGTATNSTSTVIGTGDKTLAVGENLFDVVVTAQDGITQTAYKLIVTRQQDIDTSLKSIGVVGYDVVKVDNNHYTLTVKNNVTSVTVNAIATSEGVVITGTGDKILSVGSNIVKVTVTSPSGALSVYEINITRQASSDATLKTLSVAGYAISPTFEAETLEYALTVPYNVASVTINATVNNSEASLTGTGEYNLKVGVNTATVIVTAGDKTTKEYVITITRSEDSTNTLKNLSLTNCTLSPTFESEVTNYSCTVANSITSTIVSATATSDVASVEVTGGNNLVIGKNTVDILVTAQSGATKKYTVTIMRVASNDATLKNLTISSGTLSPAFSSNTTSYTANVSNNVIGIVVTPTVNNNEASFVVSGNTNLKVGENTVTITVTAGDGTNKTYTIIVTRKKETVATLSALKLTDCTLSPTFASETTSYSCTVSNNVAKTTVSAQATSSNATVSGTGEKNLDVGKNTITVKVTAQDGTTTKSYTITVTRLQDTDNTLKSLSLTNCTLSPTFASETISYSCTVENDITSTIVTAETNSSEATVSGTGEKTLLVGENRINIIVTAQDGTIKTYVITINRKDVTEKFEITYFFGFYAEDIVTIDYSDDKTEIINVTVDETKIQNIKNAGFTLIPLDCTSGDRNYMAEAIKALDKYGIKVLVKDSTIGWTLFTYEEVKELGVNPDEFCNDPNKIYCWSDETAKANLLGMVEYYSKFSNVLGWDIGDEPQTKRFDRLGFIFKYLEECDPSKYSYINLLPNYADDYNGTTDTEPDYRTGYLDKFMSTTNSEVISIDHYGDRFFYESGYDYTEKNDYYKNLLDVLDIHRNTGALPMNISLITKHWSFKYLSRNDIAYEVSTNLAFGMKRLSYFTYTTPPTDANVTSWEGAILDSNMNPTSHYYDVQYVNSWAYSIGNELYNKEVSDIYGINEVEVLTNYNTVNTVGEINATSSAIITFFDDESFMLVNTDLTNDNSITFTDGSNTNLSYMQWFNPETSKWENIGSLDENGNLAYSDISNDYMTINPAGNTIGLKSGHSILLRRGNVYSIRNGENTVDTIGKVTATTAGSIMLFDDNSFILVNTDSTNDNAFTFNAGDITALINMEWFNPETNSWETIDSTIQKNYMVINTASNTVGLKSKSIVFLRKSQ